MPHRFPDGRPAVLPATVTQIERRLPAPGDIMVRMGSRVEPDDLVGQCSVQGEPVLLDIAGALGIEARDLRRRLRRKAGEHVAFRDLLARRRGRSVLAPFTGTIGAVDETTGFILMTPDPVPASVTASVRGYVVDLQQGRSATIETAAAVIQGRAGFGPEQWGVLSLLATDPADIVTPEMIDARSAFSIIIGGGGITAEALHKAQKEQVKGIVVGSVDAGELREFWGARFDGNWAKLLQTGVAGTPLDDGPTLLLTEGFGFHSMSRPIFDLLTHFDRQEAHLDGTTRIAAPETRPRLVIPLARLPGGIATPPPAQELRPGAIVRLLDEAYMGRIGRIESHNARGTLPSGVRTTTATVQIGEAERVVAPDGAIEVIE